MQADRRTGLCVGKMRADEMLLGASGLMLPMGAAVGLCLSPLSRVRQQVSSPAARAAGFVSS
jgi:hypothetical protein